MVILDIFGEETLRVVLVDRDDVIEQIAPTTLNPTLGNSILPGTFEGCQF